MPKDLTYARPKATTTNSTAINITGEQRESDGVRAAFAAGTTGVFEAYIRADADESGGSDVQDLYKVVLTPSIHPTTGAISLNIVTTPIEGDGTEGTATTANIAHSETMDAWQTAAGRARQA
jgi:hypothetical protein